MQIPFECPECHEEAIQDVRPQDQRNPLLTCPKCGFEFRPSEDARIQRESMRWRESFYHQ